MSLTAVNRACRYLPLGHLDGDQLAFQWRGATLTLIYSSNSAGDLNLRPSSQSTPVAGYLDTRALDKDHQN